MIVEFPDGRAHAAGCPGGWPGVLWVCGAGYGRYRTVGVWARERTAAR